MNQTWNSRKNLSPKEFIASFILGSRVTGSRSLTSVLVRASDEFKKFVEKSGMETIKLEEEGS